MFLRFILKLHFFTFNENIETICFIGKAEFELQFDIASKYNF